MLGPPCLGPTLSLRLTVKCLYFHGLWDRIPARSDRRQGASLAGSGRLYTEYERIDANEIMRVGEIVPDRTAAARIGTQRRLCLARDGVDPDPRGDRGTRRHDD